MQFLHLFFIVFSLLCEKSNPQPTIGDELMKPKKNSLKTYTKKRDFKKTPEPAPTKKARKLEHPIFVIQHHRASHDHYDFRLEINGVLKSWAIPKGPSLNPNIKRLAVETEDHPMAYATFEGIIPEGEYGGGTVMVWDIGTYKNVKDEYKKSISASYKEGKIEVFLEGTKLQGAFALIKTKYSGKPQWLFFKIDDEYASAKRNPVSRQTKSALSNKTMSQIKKEANTQWK